MEFLSHSPRFIRLLVFCLEGAALGFTAFAGFVAALATDHNFVCGASGFAFVIYTVADIAFDFVHIILPPFNRSF